MFLYHSKFESKSSLGRLHARYDRVVCCGRGRGRFLLHAIFANSSMYSIIMVFCQLRLCATTVHETVWCVRMIEWCSWTGTIEQLHSFANEFIITLAICSHNHSIDPKPIRFDDYCVWLQARAPQMTNVMCRTFDRYWFIYFSVENFFSAVVKTSSARAMLSGISLFSSEISSVFYGLIVQRIQSGTQKCQPHAIRFIYLLSVPIGTWRKWCATWFRSLSFCFH